MNRATRMLIMDRKIVVKLIEGDSFNSIVKELGVGKRRIKKLYSKALNTLSKDSGVVVPITTVPIN